MNIQFRNEIVRAALLTLLTLALLGLSMWVPTAMLLGIICLTYVVSTPRSVGKRVGWYSFLILSIFALLVASQVFGFGSYLILCLIILWVGRGISSFTGVLSACIQGAIVLLGAGLSLWVLSHSGSILLAVWSFFLAQAIWVLIPTARDTRVKRTPDKFAEAQKVAEVALSQLEAGRAT